jgi:large subunit ribosomal protein L30
MTDDGGARPIRATWRKSAIGYSEDMKATVASLGFRKLNQTRDLPDTPAVRGMLRKVDFLVAVDGEPWQPPKRSRYKIPRARSTKKHSRGR